MVLWASCAESASEARNTWLPPHCRHHLPELCSSIVSCLLSQNKGSRSVVIVQVAPRSATCGAPTGWPGRTGSRPSSLAARLATQCCSLNRDRPTPGVSSFCCLHKTAQMLATFNDNVLAFIKFIRLKISLQLHFLVKCQKQFYVSVRAGTPFKRFHSVHQHKFVYSQFTHVS